jgi:tetratricopeptide (TPR) repeat protein
MAGKIFINYRRGDDPGNTGRLFDRLQEVFASDQLFMDVDNIAPGLDFVRVLEEQVGQCDALLAVIGKGWIDARDDKGARRLDNPEDFVRIEIESALKQNKRVIPVLVGDTHMPRPEELPEAIRPLARRNAVRLSHERFRADAQGLIKALQRVLEEFDALRQADVEVARQAQAEKERKAKAAAEAEARAKAEQAEKERLAAVQAEERRKAKAAAEAEARAKKERLAAAEERRKAKAAAEAEARAKKERLATAEERLKARAAAEAEAQRRAEDAEQHRLAERRKQAEALVNQSGRELSDYDRAIATANEAIRLDPKNATAFNNRGMAYYNKGDYDRAIADFNEAIRLNPNFFTAFSNRGCAYESKGDKDQAIAEARGGASETATAFATQLAGTRQNGLVRPQG